jgi:hypothetical protein
MSARFRRSGASDINPLGLLTVIILAGTAVGAWFIARPLIRTDKHTQQARDRARDPNAAVKKFELAMEDQTARIEGRSLFAIPPEPKIAEHDGPKATTYSGPALIAYVNNTAWFSDGQKLSPEAPKSKSLELVRANPPWSVRVRWEGGEFDVELFKRIPITSLNEPLRGGSSLIPPGMLTPGSRPSSSAIAPPPALPASVQNSYPTGRPSQGSGPGALTPTNAPPPPPINPAPEPVQPAQGEPQPTNPAPANPASGGTPGQTPPAQPSPTPPSGNPNDPHPEPAPAPPPPPSEPSDP